VRRLRLRYPGVPASLYINTYADVKPRRTSAARRATPPPSSSRSARTVIFLPDEYLAGNVARETGKHIVFPTLGAPERATAR